MSATTETPETGDAPVGELVLALDNAPSAERRNLLLALQGEADATFEVELLREGDGYATYTVTTTTSQRTEATDE